MASLPGHADSGMVFATLLTLFLLPCTLTILNDDVRLGAWGLRRLRRRR